MSMLQSSHYTGLLLIRCFSLFFEHERGQKIGLWVLAINTGLMTGPMGKPELLSHLMNALIV